MWIFKLIIFISVLSVGVFLWTYLGLSAASAPYISEIGGTMGVLPAWAWIIAAIITLGAIFGLAQDSFR